MAKREYYMTADQVIPQHIDRIPSGSRILDSILGGGWARGRHHIIAGQQAAGKTTLALMAAISCQNMGLRVAYIDAEHALDRTYAKFLGVDLTRMLYPELTTGDDAKEALVTYLDDRNPFSLIVIDSIAALCPEGMYDGTNESLGGRARLVNDMFIVCNARLELANCAVIWINQLRDTIGGYGSGKIMPGGNAPQFYATTIMQINSPPLKDNSDKVIGRNITPKITKNKLGPTCYDPEPIPYVFGKGVDTSRELLTLAYRAGLITIGGTRYSFKDQVIANGKENTIALLDRDETLRVAIITALDGKPPAAKYVPPPPPSFEFKIG